MTKTESSLFLVGPNLFHTAQLISFSTERGRFEALGEGGVWVYIDEFIQPSEKDNIVGGEGRGGGVGRFFFSVGRYLSKQRRVGSTE